MYYFNVLHGTFRPQVTHTRVCVAQTYRVVVFCSLQDFNCQIFLKGSLYY